jgi:membrane-associated phospholipid phosphatase
MYAKSSNVFAAMPSMHAAFMLLVLFYGIKYKLKYWNILFAIILVGIWFSAVYTSHHYILDVIAGILSGFIAIGIIQWWMARKSGRKAMQFMVGISSK